MLISFWSMETVGSLMLDLDGISMEISLRGFAMTELSVGLLEVLIPKYQHFSLELRAVLDGNFG